jgi:hypothetical protein
MSDPHPSHGARGASTFLWHDAAPLACGALTIVATSWALITHTGYAPQHFWAGFVPVGAIAAGACAASGFYVGAVSGGRRPAPLSMALIRVSGPVAAAVTLLLSSGHEAGATIHAMSLDPSGFNRAAITGVLVYPLVILAGLGFAVGAAAVTHLLVAPIHCRRCRKYLPRRVTRRTPWPTCDFDPIAASRRCARPRVSSLVRRAQIARSNAR